MNKLSFATAMLAIVAAAAFAGNDPDALTLAQISGYKQWTGLNTEPVKVETPTGMAMREAPL